MAAGDGGATEQLLILLATAFFPPLLGLIVLIIVLASFGKSLGIRRAYVRALLRVFEWGRTRIERQQAEQRAALSPPPAADYAPRQRQKSGGNIIRHEASERIFEKLQQRPIGTKVETIIDDGFDYIKAGIESVIEDDVTSCFLTEELASWNLLTRTSYAGLHNFGWQLSLLWFGGFVFRYCILFPGRLILLTIGLIYLVSCTAIIGYMPAGRLKRWFNKHVSLMCFRILSRALSAIITYHARENVARGGGICVANHTSPIDVIMLACDNCYALIGQSHGGLLGVMQRALSRSTAHIWFERSEAGDRQAVARRLREHVEDRLNLPVLIFPEGTCINNTSVMMFKKGSFEVGATVYPVAIKYDPRFGDPFWNSAQQSWLEYMLAMMTSWAIVCDIYYLPPVDQLPTEDAIGFASRVKKLIAVKGGLVDLEWDGGLKRQPVSDKLKAQHRQLYSHRLNRTTSTAADDAPPVDELQVNASLDRAAPTARRVQLADDDTQDDDDAATEPTHRG